VALEVAAGFRGAFGFEFALGFSCVRAAVDWQMPFVQRAAARPSCAPYES